MLHEVKGKLAKLLATENLLIEHRNVETAQFDVVRRVLTLPVWRIASESVYDLLVSHEVGHALYTDSRDWQKEDKWKDVPHSFVNITEDARIEKLMKRRYAGLNKTFSRGYTELQDQDFFELEGVDLSKMSFADRANLWFKIGNYTNVPIKRGKEMEIINFIADAESFDDALEAARLMNEYAKEMTPEANITSPPPQKGEEGAEEEQEPQPQQQQSGQQSGDSDEENDNDNANEENNANEDEELGDSPVDETEAKTVTSLDDKLRQLANLSDDYISYVTVPELDLNHVVIPATDVHEYIETSWESHKERFSQIDYDFMESKSYKSFKKESAKEVSYLVKEFECKKSANSYARSSIARTGVLDCSKLHTYKYNEDLFKKVTVIPDGKNHGLLFVLDWSGSMADIMIPTLKQLYNLIWFCRKVGIPYDVYAFTNEWNYKACRVPNIQKKEDQLYIGDDFSMLNILTSKVSNSVAEKQMQSIWAIASSFTCNYGYCPPQMHLSGTPLNEALITLHHILPQFKKKTGAEKVNCVILTDGEASIPSRTILLQRDWEGVPQIRNRRITDSTFLRNLKTGELTRLSCIYHQFTKAMLNDLKSTFPEVNFIGFRIIGSGSSYNNMIFQYESSYDEQQKMRTQWKKDKSFVIKNGGYHSYFVLGNQVLSQDSEFEVSEDASKSQIKNAFRKSLANKKMNKRVLNEFIQLVA